MLEKLDKKLKVLKKGISFDEADNKNKVELYNQLANKYLAEITLNDIDLDKFLSNIPDITLLETSENTSNFIPSENSNTSNSTVSNQQPQINTNEIDSTTTDIHKEELQNSDNSNNELYKKK